MAKGNNRPPLGNETHRDRWLARLADHRLALHPDRLAAWLRSRDSWDEARRVYPLTLEVHPASDDGHLLDSEAMADRLAEAAEAGLRSVLFAGSAPLANPGLGAMLRAADLAGLATALAARPDGLAEFLEEHAPYLSWLVLVLGTDEVQTDAELGRVLGQHRPRLLFGVRLAGLPADQQAIAGLDADYVEIAGEAFGLRSVSGMPVLSRPHPGPGPETLGGCLATPFFHAFVSPAGELLACPGRAGDDRFRLGSIANATFSELWESDRRREAMAAARSLAPEACPRCGLGDANRYLRELIHPHPHVNFI